MISYDVWPFFHSQTPPFFFHEDFCPPSLESSCFFQLAVQKKHGALLQGPSPFAGPSLLQCILFEALSQGPLFFCQPFLQDLQWCIFLAPSEDTVFFGAQSFCRTFTASSSSVSCRGHRCVASSSSAGPALPPVVLFLRVLLEDLAWVHFGHSGTCLKLPSCSCFLLGLLSLDCPGMAVAATALCPCILTLA